MTIKHIFVIGAGTMGNGIAQVAATSGYAVSCMDVQPAALEKAKAVIEKSTTKLLEKGTLTKEQKTSANAIQFVSNLDSMRETGLVIEAATENPELKFKIFKDMDAAAREGVILASNTSSIPITKIAANTKRPENVIGMHFMNPVPLIKLVEVIRGFGTSDGSAKTVVDLWKEMGKEDRQRILSILNQNSITGAFRDPHTAFARHENCRSNYSRTHPGRSGFHPSDGR